MINIVFCVGPKVTVRTARSTYAQEVLQHLHDDTKWRLEGWAKPCVHAVSGPLEVCSLLVYCL